MHISKFTADERTLIKNIVATLSAKKTQDREIINIYIGFERVPEGN
jgi:hypothetical protein